MTPAVEEDHHDPSLFHDSNDRLLSSCSCSTSASDDDAPTPQNDTKPIKNDTHALPQFPFPTMCKYDAWISEPSSLSERRSRLLRQFGLPTPPSPAATIPRSSSSHQCTDTSTAAATIPRSKSDNTADRGTKHCKSSVVPIRDNDNGFLVNNNININSSISGSHSVNNRICVSVSEEGGNGEGNVVDEVEQACTIRDLDNGKEFVVKRDGVWNEVKEVGTGRRLTVEEFEMTVGHSPIVQELMRRQSAEEGRDGDGVDGEGDCGNAGGVDDEGDGGKVRRKGGWFKFMSLKSVVVGQKERRSGDERDTSSSEKAGGRRSSSATDDSQDGGSGLVQGGERVRVRQYGKSCKEVTGLYKSQKIQAHVGSIWSIKFSLDGKYLASAGEDCVIHVWRVLESERKGELLVEKPDDGNLNMLFVVNGSPEPSSPGMENNLEKKRRGRLSVSRKSLSVDQLVVPETVFALTDKPVCTFKGHLHDVLDLSWSKSQERGSGRQIGEGYEAGGLYHFGSRPRVSCVAALPPKVLNDQFGHPHLSKLKKMCPELSGLQTLECESCQLGKHVRSVFPKKSQSMCNSSFSIIHSDVWGPSRVSSFGFRYFVTFIDEYSRCTWVYLMKDRSELLPIFTSFLNEIKNQFGQVIKILRSNNAREYFSSNFSAILSSHGILHQSTCPDTPQQNGIVERKNRHLVETARTLLLGVHIPVHHWGMPS
ncbi:uncharacterized protein LOC108339168 isoform X3 [Vigna angularis]|uniref:uncharacterized protein LOC108339168 isoform X3 n=1 Tax=Phaseolus angularis TaxID=3914 RepID=UPI0022B3D270|nr:uncharacterized protein LOC108339168 isoform X3 [Vigna angularis]